MLASPADAAPRAQTTTTAPTSSPRSPDGPGFVDVVELSGLLDPVVADFIERSIEAAEDTGALWLVLRVDSSGSVLSDQRFERLSRRIAEATVPIAAWIGPSGATAKGDVGQLLLLADDVAISPGSRVGDYGGGPILDAGSWPVGASPDIVERLRDRTVGPDDAEVLGVARPAETIGAFLVSLDGFESEVDTSGDQPQRKPLTQTRFAGLPLLERQFHTVASPPVAYLLFLIGMALLLFDFYTGGVGIAGLVGAGAFVLGCYGLDVLPARWWAVALLVLAMFGFGVDVQTGVPRVWTGVAVVCLMFGSFFLYDGVRVGWVALVAGIGGLTLGMVSGMPAMVRTRFSTPTIGREWMIGELGVAETRVGPEGVVRVRDAVWRARTNRATPIDKGGSVRVVAIEGLLLEVEPEEGGARDYRERARDRGRREPDGGGDGDGAPAGSERPDAATEEPTDGV